VVVSGQARPPATAGSSPGAGPPACRPPHVMDAVELTVSRVLTVGIAFSVLLMAAGLLLGVITGSGMPRGVVPLAELLPGLVALDPAAYLSVGLIALIATPFVRVAGSIVAFAREGDRRYVVITATVLVVMCLSVLLGKV